MIPKSEYQLQLDPELNEGNKLPGIISAVEEAQSMMLPEVVFPVRVIVNKKLADYFEGNPYQFKCEFNNIGLPSQKRGIVKIILI